MTCLNGNTIFIGRDIVAGRNYSVTAIACNSTACNTAFLYTATFQTGSADPVRGASWGGTNCSAGNTTGDVGAFVPPTNSSTTLSVRLNGSISLYDASPGVFLSNFTNLTAAAASVPVSYINVTSVVSGSIVVEFVIYGSDANATTALQTILLTYMNDPTTLIYGLGVLTVFVVVPDDSSMWNSAYIAGVVVSCLFGLAFLSCIVWAFADVWWMSRAGYVQQPSQAVVTGQESVMKPMPMRSSNS